MDTWWKRQTSAELGREQMVDDVAREEREAAEARWPEDGAESEEQESEGDGVGAGRIRGGRKGRAVREGLSKAGCRNGGTKGALPVYWSHCFPYLYVE